MKPKNGKPVTKAKPVPAKKVDEKQRENHPRAAKETAGLKEPRDPDITLVNANDIAVDSVGFSCHVARKT
jgi:hypothetical protein